MATKKQWRLSASLIGSFKACAYRCYMQYVLGIRRDEDTDAQRMGTNWHRLLEINGLRPGTVCPECANGQNNPGCPLCMGTDILPDNMTNAAIRYLDNAYEYMPASKTREEWMTERAILLYSLAGYNWYYSNNDYEVIAEEIKFREPLRNPKTGRALPNVVITGMIDKIVRSPEGVYYIDEHKSTSQSVDSDSDFWNHFTLDTQTTLYPLIARSLQLNGDLEEYGIKPTDSLIAGVRADVWHKPGIRPKKLTQAESKVFAGTGEYMGDVFNVTELGTDAPYKGQSLFVDGCPIEIEPGKKEGTFAIRETPEMFGARLLNDISERPEFYFARKDIARLESDFERLRYELLNIYHTVKFLDRNNAWWQNEQQCEATFKCEYIPYCYNNVQPDSKNLLNGFKCIYGDK